MHKSYKKGLRLSRKDKNKPFGPDNFEWVTNLELAQTNTHTIRLTYNGETKTLREWSNVVPCCYVCNCARNNNFSFDEMKILGKTIKKIMEDRLSGNGN